jgi:hypothetical protein
MHIFWRLVFGHLLADFTFQTNYINTWKRNSVIGMLVHCLTHPVTYVVLTFPFLGETWVDFSIFQLNGWACITIIFVTHFLEDYWRVYTIHRYHTPDNTLYFIWDQVIHYAVIFAVIPEAFRGPAPVLVPEKWPVLGCLFVLVTHASTVLIYFFEKDTAGRIFPEFEEKYLTKAERLVLGLCFLFPGKTFILLALAWSAGMYYVRKRRFADFSWPSLYLGWTVTFFSGIVARYVYYS